MGATVVGNGKQDTHNNSHWGESTKSGNWQIEWIGIEANRTPTTIRQKLGLFCTVSYN